MKLLNINLTLFIILVLLSSTSKAQDGTLDETFDFDGKLNTYLNSSDNAKSVAIQDDRKIIVAGYTNENTMDISLIRYNTDGSLDNSFGNNGIVITDIDSSNNFAESVAIQSDGKIVVAGYTYNQTTGNDFLLLRYNSNGSLDTTFNSTGIVITVIDSLQDYAKSLVIQPDGKMVVAGNTLASIDYNQFYYYYDFVIVRYNSDGSLDNSFGSNGIVTTSFSASSTESVSDVAIQSDGKIVVTGNSQVGFDSDFALARYNTDGSLDNSFGSNGMITTSIDSVDASYSVSIQSDQKIIIAGTSFQNVNPGFTTLRYNSDGSLDSSFGDNGIVVTHIDSLDVALSTLALNNQKIIVGGYTSNGNEMDFALVRYNNDGTLDSTFHYDGIAKTDFGSTNDIVNDVALMLYGKRIVAVGQSSNSGNSDIAVAVYHNSPQPVSVKNNNTNTIPKSFELSQNYPNPFNPTTTINYSIPTPLNPPFVKRGNTREVTLKVYDVLGKEVATLVNKKQTAGNYKVTFNASSLSSGIYFYRLTTGGFVEIKKMVLLQ